MSASATVRERLWRVCADGTAVVGALCAIDEWGWQLSVAGAISTGFLFVILGLPFTEGTFAAMRRLYARGALVGIALVAASGLVMVGRVAGAVLVAMLAASSPRLRELVRARWAMEPDEEPAPSGVLTTDPLPEPTDVSQLDDSALCLQWRSTFVALQASRSAAHRLRVVRQREAILDELQRRCPEGFDAWLAAGARAPSNPLPFVRRPPR